MAAKQAYERKIYQRYFNVMCAKVFNLFEDCLAVSMFELGSSVKHGNIDKCCGSVMSKEVHFLDHVMKKRAKFLGARGADSKSCPGSAIMCPFWSSYLHRHMRQDRSVPVKQVTIRLR